MSSHNSNLLLAMIGLSSDIKYLWRESNNILYCSGWKGRDGKLFSREFPRNLHVGSDQNSVSLVKVNWVGDWKVRRALNWVYGKRLLWSFGFDSEDKEVSFLRFRGRCQNHSYINSRTRCKYFSTQLKESVFEFTSFRKNEKHAFQRRGSILSRIKLCGLPSIRLMCVLLCF